MDAFKPDFYLFRQGGSEDSSYKSILGAPWRSWCLGVLVVDFYFKYGFK